MLIGLIITHNSNNNEVEKKDRWRITWVSVFFQNYQQRFDNCSVNVQHRQHLIATAHLGYLRFREIPGKKPHVAHSTPARPAIIIVTPPFDRQQTKPHVDIASDTASALDTTTSRKTKASRAQKETKRTWTRKKRAQRPVIFDNDKLLLYERRREDGEARRDVSGALISRYFSGFILSTTGEDISGRIEEKPRGL